MGCRRGSSLLHTLALTAIVVLVAFVAVGISFHQLNITQAFKNSAEARDLAEAAVAQAIEKLIRSDGKFGKAGQEQTVNVTFSHSAPEERGFLTFDEDLASSQKVSVSTQNLEGQNAVLGAGGRTVPRESVRFMVQGRARGMVRNLEVIVHIPTYANALACEGPINSPGKLIVGSVDKVDDLLPTVDSNLSKLLPAHVASNGAGAEAIKFDANDAGHAIYVSGNARAMGQIKSGTEVQIKGEKRPNAARLNIPEIPLSTFDPNNFGFPHDVDITPMPDNLPARGLVRHKGDISTRSLQLPSDSGSGAVVYVEGNLTLEEGIRGNGAVICTGNLTIRGAGTSDVRSDQTAALVAGGDLLLSGNDRNASFFKGLLYSGGETVIHDATVMGVLVGKGSDKSMKLENVNFIHDPKSIDFKFTMPFQVGAGTGGVDVRLGPKKSPDTGNYSLADFYVKALDQFKGPVKDEHLGYWLIHENRFAADVNEAAGKMAGALTDAQVDKLCAEAVPPITTGTREEKLAAYLTWLRDFALNSHQGINASLVKINDWYKDHHGQPLDSGQFQLSPNRFLPLKDSLRVALWREL